MRIAGKRHFRLRKIDSKGSTLSGAISENAYLSLALVKSQTLTRSKAGTLIPAFFICPARMRISAAHASI